MKSELLDYAQKLKVAGFNVYKNTKGGETYFFFEDKEGKIGYCQLDYGFSFSSVHKPNRTTGTGFSIHKEVYTPTVQHAKDSLCRAPHWASSIETVKKYKNFKEYIGTNRILKYEQF